MCRNLTGQYGCCIVTGCACEECQESGLEAWPGGCNGGVGKVSIGS